MRLYRCRFLHPSGASVTLVTFSADDDETAITIALALYEERSSPNLSVELWQDDRRLLNHPWS